MAASADNALQHPRVCHILYNAVRKFPNVITIPIEDVSGVPEKTFVSGNAFR